MQTVTIKVYPYTTSGGDPVTVDAPCRIVGESTARALASDAMEKGAAL